MMNEVVLQIEEKSEAAFTKELQRRLASTKPILRLEKEGMVLLKYITFSSKELVIDAAYEIVDSNFFAIWKDEEGIVGSDGYGDNVFDAKIETKLLFDQEQTGTSVEIHKHFADGHEEIEVLWSHV